MVSPPNTVLTNVKMVMPSNRAVATVGVLLPPIRVAGSAKKANLPNFAAVIEEGLTHVMVNTGIALRAPWFGILVDAVEQMALRDNPRWNGFETMIF